MPAQLHFFSRLVRELSCFHSDDATDASLTAPFSLGDDNNDELLASSVVVFLFFL
jgi:hypothetical protein